IKVDVRVIAATNRPLEQAVASRQFREDLFYRLNVVRIEVPPLRERLEDIRLLVNYFLKKFAKHQKQAVKSISPVTLAALERYSWPGNVRELENVIQRALVISKGDVILPSDLPAELQPNRPAVPIPQVSSQPDAGAAAGPASASGSGSSFDLAGVVRGLFQWARQQSQLKLIPAIEREL